jgi:nucleoid-associated protein YgaU
MHKKLIILAVLVALLLVPAAALAQGGSDYTVQADDTLGKIAEKEYGDPLAYTAIVFYTNQQAADDDTISVIEDPNTVEAGQVIYLPTAEEANAYLIGNIQAEATRSPNAGRDGRRR